MTGATFTAQPPVGRPRCDPSRRSPSGSSSARRPLPDRLPRAARSPDLSPARNHAITGRAVEDPERGTGRPDGPAFSLPVLRAPQHAAEAFVPGGRNAEHSAHPVRPDTCPSPAGWRTRAFAAPPHLPRFPPHASIADARLGPRRSGVSGSGELDRIVHRQRFARNVPRSALSGWRIAFQPRRIAERPESAGTRLPFRRTGSRTSGPVQGQGSIQQRRSGCAELRDGIGVTSSWASRPSRLSSCNPTWLN
jgi:hypothetical protein